MKIYQFLLSHYLSVSDLKVEVNCRLWPATRRDKKLHISAKEVRAENRERVDGNVLRFVNIS